MSYTLPDLPYDYSALEPHYQAENLQIHHDKHHAAYVSGANSTEERLSEAREKGDFANLVGLEKTLAFNISGHMLHSIFWKNMSPDGGGAPEGELAAAIQEHFGSFDAFKAQLTQAAVLVQGSGWGALSWEPLGQRLIVQQIYDHHANLANGSTPLLVIDVWEHAYYLQYRNMRADFVNAIWNVINWPDIAARFEAARKNSIN
ncbi:MAG: superoxide dismutase [Actinobacteria bacterium]|jgi:Fe-Mn family superoxide dismutase|nr:superoxide dismutase [Actinomycetota bacterium]